MLTWFKTKQKCLNSFKVPFSNRTTALDTFSAWPLIFCSSSEDDVEGYRPLITHQNGLFNRKVFFKTRESGSCSSRGYPLSKVDCRWCLSLCMSIRHSDWRKKPIYTLSSLIKLNWRQWAVFIWSKLSSNLIEVRLYRDRNWIINVQ